MMRRGSGILLHITSLPSGYGIGDLGPQAYRFADFCEEAKQSYWQILPLNPTDPAYYNSPYHSISAFAHNPLLISPELMIENGLVSHDDLEPAPQYPENRVDHRAVIPYKKRLFQRAYERFKKRKNRYDYERFCSESSHWLDDFALFVCLRNHFHGEPWSNWPVELRDRHGAALNSFRKELLDQIQLVKFTQYVFGEQWYSLKRYCREKGIHIIGDTPIYVDYDSADVWTHPEFFKLDEQKRPYVVAGVPPDYFSETGQLWGNPLYRWDVLKDRGYNWWIRRVEHNLGFVDFLRVDHFRGFVAYWEVPASHNTAIQGNWVEAPAVDFFGKLCRAFPHLPIIAEDLGIITPDVRELMHHFEFPGMKVLLFAFGEDLPTNPYIPHNLVRNCVLYTGTHDNNTVRGWFQNEATTAMKRRLFDYLGGEVPSEHVNWELIRLAMMSVADIVIVPAQDVLGLGEEARMNRPSTLEGNWEWKLFPEQLTSEVAARLSHMTEIYGRV